MNSRHFGSNRNVVFAPSTFVPSSPKGRSRARDPTREPRVPKQTAALRLAMAFAALAALTISACKSDPTASLRAQWRECVTEAFRAESATIADRAKAAQVAFLACQAQEEVLFKKALEHNPYAAGTQNQLREREMGRLLKQP